MATSVRLTAIGNSTGIILPKEVMARMHLEKGDQLFITETAEGIQLTPYNPGFEKTLDVARRVMRENRDVLRRLAE